MLQFTDHTVPYSVFLDDLAKRIAEHVIALQQQPEHLSQRQAYRIFGRANVERWLRQNLIHPCKRPGKVEYLTSELRQQQLRQQDYFTNPSPQLR